MLAVSTEFLQAIKNKAPQDVRLEFANGDVIGASDIAITSGGLTYTEILNGETDVTFGRAVMSELSAVLINADGRFTDFDFSREFTAKIGVKVGDSFEYVSLGVFKGERPDKVRGKLIDFTAHDRMSLFDKSAESFVVGLTFPCTLGEIYTKLCSFCGVGYVSATFTNSGKNFTKNPLEGTDYTCREILGYIAEAAGSYARMSRDGAVELVWFAAADYTVTRTDRFEMTESEFETPPIDKLEVYNSYGDQLNSAGSGDIVYGISDNPFLYIENDTQLAGLQPYVDVIYNRITSLPAYHPSSFRAEFNPAVQCGDIISVVDDYDETIRFPVFVQTITWNGFGKATYENTGGVIRQNAPFTQRELEQIKKKSLRAVDLYTTIDSYLSTEEGFAAIESAVGGKFVTADDLDEYVKTTELETKITQEVKDGIASLSLSATETTVTSEVPYGNNVPAGTDYEFELTADGYYTSANKSIASSYAYTLYEFPASDTDVKVIIRCINYAESTYDYGIVSTLNTLLSYAPSNDGVNVQRSFSGLSSPDPVDIEMTIPASDNAQFISVKYIKDGSQNANNDAFKFKVIKKSSEKSLVSTIKLTQGSAEISSAEITLTGVVTFESLETEGATVINGANITTGKISADRIDTSDLYVEKVYMGGDNTREILSSYMNSNTSGQIHFGFIEPMTNESWSHDMYIYAKKIFALPPGGDEDGNYNFVQISPEDAEISFFPSNDWELSDLYRVTASRFRFDDGSYLRVYDGALRFTNSGGNHIYLT